MLPRRTKPNDQRCRASRGLSIASASRINRGHEEEYLLIILGCICDADCVTGRYGDIGVCEPLLSMLYQLFYYLTNSVVASYRSLYGLFIQ